MNKVNCQQCIDFLADYLDGELPAEQRDFFEKHLTMCPPCKEYLESYQRAIQLGRKCECECECDSAAQPMPEELVKAILDSLKRGGGAG